MLDRINAALEGYLERLSDVGVQVGQAMRYSLMAGGKRVRPVLTLEFARILGGEPELALPLACAVEMVHTYSLIHDDLPCMDDDDLRRGKPSCHAKFGEWTALLAGDALLTLAFEVAAQSGLAPAQTVAAVGILARASGVHGMIGGQELDLQSEGQAIGRDLLLDMHARKTGALMAAACVLGAVAAGARQERSALAQTYGEALGMAFQITDDILNATGDAQSLGKPVGSDRDKGKANFVSMFGVDASRQMARDYSDKAKAILARLGADGLVVQLTDSLLNREN